MLVGLLRRWLVFHLCENLKELGKLIDGDVVHIGGRLSDSCERCPHGLVSNSLNVDVL